jgi:CheY-like chemotaxis protein
VTALRVLIVDDLEDNGELLCAALQMRGYEARYARDGAAALALAVDFAPHVAILDVLMPDINGYELGRQLRELPGQAKLCLIAISGFDRDARGAKAAGFHGHMIKPFTLDRLEQAVRAGYEEATR